jgi:hypothetical protein
MTDEERHQYYIAYETAWAKKPCTYCGRTASAHGFLFKESPPLAPAADERKAVGEVYFHGETPECVCLSESERPSKS